VKFFYSILTKAIKKWDWNASRIKIFCTYSQI